ncbi:MAG: hypothetical protein EBX50_18580, partial [Chitinophagia bacterium]|nr:hypothetical protein [Chitinophagia bacterium]
LQPQGQGGAGILWHQLSHAGQQVGQRAAKELLFTNLAQVGEMSLPGLAIKGAIEPGVVEQTPAHGHTAFGDEYLLTHQEPLRPCQALRQRSARMGSASTSTCRP